MIASTRVSIHKHLKAKHLKDICTEPPPQPLLNNCTNNGVTDSKLMEELSFYKKAANDADAVATYWKTVAESFSPTLSPSDQGRSSEQVEIMRSLLAEKTAELEQSKLTMSKAQQEMQKEFATLWRAVEELSEVEASKDKALLSLTSDRNRFSTEKQEALVRLRRLKNDYKALQEEVHTIDEDLINAVEAEGISIEELLGLSHRQV